MSGISLSCHEGIAKLILDRPDKHHALDRTMIETLDAHRRKIAGSTDIHVVILSATGRTFCSGGDIDAWSALNPDRFANQWLSDGHQTLDALARLRQPVIAVLAGDVLGGGLELAACADYRIAETHIRIGQPETGLGMIPGWSGTQRAVRRLGAQAVRRMALFGEMLDAETAARLGVIDRIAETGNGMDMALHMAATMRRRSPVACELVKMLINTAEREERERVIESLAGRIAADHPDLATGLDAFKARHKPTYWPRSHANK